MNPPKIRINPERLLGDLHRLRSFGAHGNGVVRQSLTPIDMESRRWLCERMREAGLEARIDEAASASPNPGRTGSMHRLNRTEYGNAIRDFLALEIDVAALLPGD